MSILARAVGLGLVSRKRSLGYSRGLDRSLGKSFVTVRSVVRVVGIER